MDAGGALKASRKRRPPMGLIKEGWMRCAIPPLDIPGHRGFPRRTWNLSRWPAPRRHHRPQMDTENVGLAVKTIAEAVSTQPARPGWHMPREDAGRQSRRPVRSSRRMPRGCLQLPHRSRADRHVDRPVGADNGITEPHQHQDPTSRMAASVHDRQPRRRPAARGSPADQSRADPPDQWRRASSAATVPG